MRITLIEVFDKHFEKVKFDGRLAKLVYQYQLGYVNQNKEHLEFFGGNLLGVQTVRFKDSDVSRLFNEVLDVDYIELSKDLKTVTDVYQDNKVTADVYNLTCMYMIHKFLTSGLVNDTIKKRGAYDSAVIFFYRCLAALISYNFKYPTDPKIAQVAYANLSNKFLIKKLGSWHKVVDYRSNDLTDVHGIHAKTLRLFNNDLSVVYAISDSKDRIKDLIKNYCKEFFKVWANGDSIATTSSTYLSSEGEDTFKEKTRSTETYVAYLRNSIMDKHSFVNDNLISVISDINKNSSFRMIKQSLHWMSEEYNKGNHEVIDNFITSVVIYSFYLMETNNLIGSKDYPKILLELKNLYLSTRSTDTDLVVIRKHGETIVKKSSSIKLSNSLIYATRTSLVLYLTLKTLTGK